MSSSELSQPEITPPDLSYRNRLRREAVRWRENPERLAWIIMLASFAVFVAMCFMVPSAARYTFRHLTMAQTASLIPTLGTTGKLLLYRTSDSEGIAVFEKRDDLGEGMRVVSRDGAIQGVIEFFDEVNPALVIGTIRMFSDTELDVQRIRRPVFQSSPEPYRVKLVLKKGQLRLINNPSEGVLKAIRPLDVVIETPHGMVHFDAGNYQISVNTAQTDVSVNEGLATLQQNRGQSLNLTPSTRSWMDQEQIADIVTETHHSLLSDNVLDASVLQTWENAPIGQSIAGTAEFIVYEGQQVAIFKHEGTQGHSEVGIIRKIDRDILAYESLNLQMNVRILVQSLPGAGQVSSEYPIRVEMDYTDVYGKNLRWGYGFYLRDPKPDEPYPIPVDNESGRAIRVAQLGNWYPFQSENLIELWKTQGTPPARINHIRIYASGHTYQSMVSEVYLIGK